MAKPTDLFEATLPIFKSKVYMCRKECLTGLCYPPLL